MQQHPEPHEPWTPPAIHAPAFTVLSEEEAAAIRGGGHTGKGLCVLVGASCSTNGGPGFGLCVIGGVSTRDMNDPPESPSHTKAGLCVVLGYACWARGGFHAGLCFVVGATTEPQ